MDKGCDETEDVTVFMMVRLIGADFFFWPGKMSQKLVCTWFLVCALSVHSCRFPQQKELASLVPRAPRNQAFPRNSIKFYQKSTMILRGGQDPSALSDLDPSSLHSQQDQVSYCLFIGFPAISLNVKLIGRHLLDKMTGWRRGKSSEWTRGLHTRGFCFEGAGETFFRSWRANRGVGVFLTIIPGRPWVSISGSHPNINVCCLTPVFGFRACDACKCARCADTEKLANYLPHEPSFCRIISG